MRALYWGFGTAVVHRVALTLWFVLVWGVLGANLSGAQVDFHTASAQLPPLTSPADEAIFGVWRRWDAVHYLDLAANGYRVDHPGPSVFGILTPYGIRAFDAVLPGSLDLGALVFETLAFGLALTLLYKVCETYYVTTEDNVETGTHLGRWAVVVTALLPLSYFFEAPMSESIYLAMVLGVFYFGTKRQWLFAAICGALATLARSQGALLFPVAGLLLLEQNGFSLPKRDQWLAQAIRAIRQGWVLLLIPLTYIGFILYRQSLGLPPLDVVYNDYSYVYLTNPIDGLITNFRWIITHPADAATNVDLLAMLLVTGLTIATFFFRRHRRLPLIAYTVGSILVFVSKVNYIYGTDQVIFTQSFARYTLALFPLTVLVADGIRSTTPLVRVISMAFLLLGFVGFSALYLLALTGP